MTHSEERGNNDEPQPLIDVLQDQQNPEATHKDISDLILSSHLVKQDLGRYILAKAVGDIFLPDDVYPCVIHNTFDDTITTAIADAEGTRLHTAETYSKKELDSFTLPSIAIQAYFDYAGYDFTYNN